MITVDARGLSCPEPLLMASDALKENAGETITVLVDSASARDNIERRALREKRSVTISQAHKYYEIVIS